MALIADFLGVTPLALETALSYKAKLIKEELCMVFLDLDGATDNPNNQVKMPYSLLFSWLNKCLCCCDDLVSFIGLFDLPTEPYFSPQLS